MPGPTLAFTSAAETGRRHHDMTSLWWVIMRPLIGHHVTVMISALSGPGPLVSVAGLCSPLQRRVWRRYPLTRNSGDHSCHLCVIWVNWPLILVLTKPFIWLQWFLVIFKSKSDFYKHLIRPNRRWWAVGGRWKVVSVLPVSDWLIIWPLICQCRSCDLNTCLWLAIEQGTRSRQLCVPRLWWTCFTSPSEPWCSSCTTRPWSGPSTPTTTTSVITVSSVMMLI